MKHFKKFLAIFLSITMIVSATLPSFASGNGIESNETSVSVEATIETSETTTTIKVEGKENPTTVVSEEGETTTSDEADEETTTIEEEPEEDESTTVENTEDETTIESEETTNESESSTENEEATSESESMKSESTDDGESTTTANESSEESTTISEETTVDSEETTTVSESSKESTTASEETTTESSTYKTSETAIETVETTISWNNINVVDEVKIATESNLDKEELFGTGEWCYWVVDETDPDNVTIHYSSIEPADYNTYPSGKKGKTSNTDPTRPAPCPSSSIVKQSIKTAVFDDTITAVTANNWFWGFTNLTTITNLSNLDLSNVTSMFNMFKGCTSLTNIDYPNMNASQVTDIRNMFDGCTSLTNVNLNSMTFGAVQKSAYMFRGCSQLSSVTIGSLFSNTVINIDASYMFQNCTSLTTLNLNGLDMGNVSNMSYMFDGCTALTSLDFSNTTTGAVTTISYMFRNCANLINLNLSNFVTANVTNKSSALQNCDNLRTFNLSAGFASIINSTGLKGDWKKSTSDTIYEYKSGKTTIPAEAGEFQRAFKITFDSKGGNAIAPVFKTYNESLTLTNPLRPGFTFDGWYNEAEYTNPVVSPITVTGERTIYAKWSGGEGITLVYWGLGKKNNSGRTLYLSMKELSLGYTYQFVGSFANAADFNSETDVPWHAFRSEIYSVSVQSNVSPTYFKCKSMAYWFKDMIRLKSTSISSLTNHNDLLESIAHAFDGCTNLTTIHNISVSNNFKNMDSAFKNCTKLRVIQVQKLYGVPSADLNIVLQNGGFKDAFLGCTSLRRVNLRYFDFSSYSGDVFSFAGLTSLVKVRVKNSGDLFNRVNLSGEWWEYESGNKYTSANMPTNVAQIRKYETFSNTIYWYIQGTELHISSAMPSNSNYKNGHYFNGDETNAYGMLPINATINTIVLDNNIIIKNNSGSSFFPNLGSLATEIRNMSYLNTSEVTDMSGMFDGMEELFNVDLSNLNTHNVTDMTIMFEGCKKLINLDLSNFNTSKVTAMNGMFVDCAALRTVNVSSFNTSRVETMEYMFENCSSLETLDLSSFSTESLEEGYEYNDDGIWLMFDGCSSLRTIYVSNNFVITYDPDATVSGSGIFDGCENLVGGNGTTYSDEHRYADYACIDTAEHPGYFTYREAPEPGPTPGPTPAPISSISVNTPPTKLSYDVGERFNPAGLKIKLNYATGGSAIVTYDNSTKDNFSFNPSLTTALTETNTYVTITYGGKSCRQNITVLPVKDIASISIVKKPNTTSYYAGYRLKPDGLVVRAHYTDGTTTDIIYTSGNADRFTFNPTLTTNLTIYMNEVEVTYRGMTATFAISVTKNSGGDTPSGGGSSSGGSGSATTGPIPPTPTSYTPNTTVVAATKAISGTLEASNVNWAVDPATGKWVLGTTINGQSTLVSNGFFQINSTATQNVYGIATQVPVSNTYYFDATGAMVTGWVKTGDNKWYFFENAKTANEGKMQVGWKVVEGSWYFFGADGAMYENQVTPDGHVVGADGRWVQV